MTQQWIKTLTEQHKIIVLLGAGGVGKTSSSLGLAVMAAREGKKVGLLSIDPARRLASALGLHAGQALHQVSFPAEFPVRGELHAAMLDPKEVFDSMVHRHAPDQATAGKILRHPLYKAASERLAGAAEYMALAKLQDMCDNGGFDLIVLDTPPDDHALDFLSKPDILANFRDNKVMAWLVRPFYVASKIGVNRLFSVGERLMGGLARVTGLEALRSLAEFLVLIQQVIEGFHSAGEKILATLKSRHTAFVLVTSPGRTSLRSALRLSGHLKEASFALAGIFFNRCMPIPLMESLKNSQAAGAEVTHPWVLQLLQRMQDEHSLISSFLTELNRNTGSSPATLRLSEQKECIHNKESLWRFSFEFFPGQGEPASKL